jgi:hypothetical protein
MKLEIGTDGTIRMLHDDKLDLSEIGRPEMTRASHVEFDNSAGCWYVQSARTLQILKSGFQTRAQALAWKRSGIAPAAAAGTN